MEIYLPQDEGVEFPREEDVINWAEHDAHAQDADDDPGEEYDDGEYDDEDEVYDYE